MRDLYFLWRKSFSEMLAPGRYLFLSMTAILSVVVFIGGKGGDFIALIICVAVSAIFVIVVFFALPTLLLALQSAKQVRAAGISAREFVSTEGWAKDLENLRERYRLNIKTWL